MVLPGFVSVALNRLQIVWRTSCSQAIGEFLAARKRSQQLRKFFTSLRLDEGKQERSVLVHSRWVLSDLASHGPLAMDHALRHGDELAVPASLQQWQNFTKFHA